jgi:hypothetical protein
MGLFLGYCIEGRSGEKLFLSTRFDQLVDKLRPHLRHELN